MGAGELPILSHELRIALLTDNNWLDERGM